jgi:hypothetical protein
MRARVQLAAGVAVLGTAAVTAAAVAGDGEKLRTRLSGVEEVPAVITSGQGTFEARLSESADQIDYELSYAELEGGEVRQAHIHVGQQAANGGIVAWLCDSSTNPAPAGVDVGTCPASGTVTGTIDAADVQAATAVPTQGFRDNADKFAKLVTALQEGVAYANVHTATSTGGEIRGQIVDRQDD